MELFLRRMAHDKDSTSGYILNDGVFECFTLEDQFNEPKIAGITRIPAGKYKVKLREEPTPLTMKYRQKYGEWFNFHLEVQNVPNFKNVYIHVGNTDENTNGCILVGDSLVNQGAKEDFLGNSRQAFKRLYIRVTKAIREDEEVRLTITDR